MTSNCKRAANEVAVQHFAMGEITVPQIWHCVEKVMHSTKTVKVDALETVIAADKEARILAGEFVNKIKK